MFFDTQSTVCKRACDYSSSYTEIYDSPYGCNFVFVDDEDDCDVNDFTVYEATATSSRFLTQSRQHRRKVLKIIIAKA